MSAICNLPERLAYTMPEVARLTGLSARTVWTLINTHQLKSFRVGRSVRVTRQALDEFLAERENAR